MSTVDYLFFGGVFLIILICSGLQFYFFIHENIDLSESDFKHIFLIFPLIAISPVIDFLINFKRSTAQVSQIMIAENKVYVYRPFQKTTVDDLNDFSIESKQLTLNALNKTASFRCNCFTEKQLEKLKGELNEIIEKKKSTP